MDLTLLKNKTQNQSATIGSTTFSGDMNIGTPLISTNAIYGSSTTIFGDLILSGVNVENINVRSIINSIQGNILDTQLDVTNLQALTSNMMSVPDVSTTFTGELFSGLLNVGTTIHQNVIDIQYLQQDIETAKDNIITLQNQVETLTTTTEHQASHITSLENQIEILNAQFDTMNFSNGFMDQISNNPFDNEFIDLFH